MNHCLFRNLTPRAALLLLLAASFLAPAGLVAQEQEEVSVNANPDEIRRGVRMGGEEGKSRTQVYFERIISRFQPEIAGDPEEMPLYIQQFKVNFLNDPKLFPFHAEGEMTEDGTLVLTGYAGFEENKVALERMLTYMHFDQIDNQIEVLPSESLGERRYGIVRVPHVITYDGPEEPRENMTDALMGDHVYLLKEEADHYLVHTSEGYVSWIPAEAVVAVDEEAMTYWLSGPQITVISNIGNPGDESFIPAGARLKKSQSASAYGEGGIEVMMPDGRTAELDPRNLMIHDAEPNPLLLAAIETAREMLDRDYVWGGKTLNGVDCSGLVQSSMKAHGINMPRDAYQQAYVGSMTGTRWYRDNIRPGDTLYFLGSSGKITHTAIYVGNDVYLEASGGDVHYTSFNPEHDNYNERKDQRFCFAKRVLE